MQQVRQELEHRRHLPAGTGEAVTKICVFAACLGACVSWLLAGVGCSKCGKDWNVADFYLPAQVSQITQTLKHVCACLCSHNRCFASAVAGNRSVQLG